MIRLTPQIQEHVLSLPEMSRRTMVTERALRSISRIADPRDQMKHFVALIP
jgi:hypothetical protein